jgi:hypothetical protein
LSCKSLSADFETRDRKTGPWLGRAQLNPGIKHALPQIIGACKLDIAR